MGLMRDLDWLQEMSTQALPAGAAAAALSSAMGAALIAKAMRRTLRRTLERGPSSGTTRAALEATLHLADSRRIELQNLAEADERAYAAVLAGGGRGEAHRDAVDVPLRIAEACQGLLAALPGVFDACWPAVRPDLEIGGWLLETGRKASRFVAETNLRNWGDTVNDASLWARLEVLV